MSSEGYYDEFNERPQTSNSTKPSSSPGNNGMSRLWNDGTPKEQMKGFGNAYQFRAPTEIRTESPSPDNAVVRRDQLRTNTGMIFSLFPLVNLD